MRKDFILHVEFYILHLKQCQGDHGSRRANYRCCLPALAGFVSPQSMGPGLSNVEQHSRGFKEKEVWKSCTCA